MTRDPVDVAFAGLVREYGLNGHRPDVIRPEVLEPILAVDEWHRLCETRTLRESLGTPPAARHRFHRSLLIAAFFGDPDAAPLEPGMPWPRDGRFAPVDEHFRPMTFLDYDRQFLSAIRVRWS